MLRVDDLEVGILLDIFRSYLAATIYIDEQRGRFARLGDEKHFFKVKYDISDIFDNAVDALKLVLDAVYLNRGDGSTFD